MKRVYQRLYAITLYNPMSNEEQHNQVLLHVKEHRTMSKKIDEIVYVDENNKEWALKSIEPNNK